MTYSTLEQKVTNDAAFQRIIRHCYALTEKV